MIRRMDQGSMPVDVLTSLPPQIAHPRKNAKFSLLLLVAGQNREGERRRYRMDLAARD